MGNSLDSVRASRYRRLALLEKDKTSADLLNQLAREAELGILFTSDRHWRTSPPHHLRQSDSSQREPLQGKRVSVVADFPWPVTDEELVLNEALAGVMNACEARGDIEDGYVREAAAKLIAEAYNQGIRDADVLAHYALKALNDGGGDGELRLNGS